MIPARKNRPPMMWRSETPFWRRGESLAAWRLRLRGYRILARNVRCGHGEIDIIARRGSVTAFVEVRTRAVADPVPPEDTVTFPKRQHLRAAARRWLAATPQPDGMSYRFDVVGVILPPRGKAQVTHHPDAFRMDE